MEKFIVSARKYRPQNFSTVIGQSHITTTLKNAINNNQLAHAFLFCGPRGVGKTTCARILAKTINCENRTAEGEACNSCNSCVSFDNGNSFNIHELDAASNNSVEDIRDLAEQVRFSPQAGKYKVYIVDEVHMLSSSAFNAFLKTLEEPPAHAIFILATTEKHKILPTILSRCQIFDFKRITTTDTVEHLQEIINKEHITAEKAALHVIAQKSEGCLRDALSILDKIVSFTGGQLTYANTLEHLNILDEDYYFKLIDQMQKQQLADAMLLFDEINQKGFEGDTLLEGFAEFIRNILVCKDVKASKLLDVAEDFKPKYLENAISIDMGWLIAALNIISETAISYKQARNKKLHIELALIKLTYLKQALHLTFNDEGLHKKKAIDGVKPVSFRALPVIQAPDSKPRAVKAPKVTTSEATLTIEEPKINITEKKVTPAEIPVSTTEKPTTKLGSLSKIRGQVASQFANQNAVKPITADELTIAWNLFIEKLSEEKNHSAVTNFRLSLLKVIDENNFEVVTESNIQQKFIEAERAGLISHLQQYFNNKALKYQISIVEKEAVVEEGAVVINSKEHYRMLTEQYPLIKELKEKLRLEL
jgi:DNA polymerase-3 subunit gamma/tau